MRILPANRHAPHRAEAGVPVEVVRTDGPITAFVGMGADIAEARLAMELLAREIRGWMA